MKGILFSAVIACSFLIAAARPSVAQHGDASDYQAPGFSGDTWTGEITGINTATRELTLTATTKKGDETFVAYLPEHYTQQENGKDSEVQMSDFGIGQHIRVYYILKHPKVNGQKVKRNEIIRIESITADKK